MESKKSEKYKTMMLKACVDDFGQYNVGWSPEMKDEFMISMVKKWEENLIAVETIDYIEIVK